jgi:hypothetical protein
MTAHVFDLHSPGVELFLSPDSSTASLEGPSGSGSMLCELETSLDQHCSSQEGEISGCMGVVTSARKKKKGSKQKRKPRGGGAENCGSATAAQDSPLPPLPPLPAEDSDSQLPPLPPPPQVLPNTPPLDSTQQVAALKDISM